MNTIELFFLMFLIPAFPISIVLLLNLKNFIREKIEIKKEKEKEEREKEEKEKEEKEKVYFIEQAARVRREREKRLNYLFFYPLDACEEVNEYRFNEEIRKVKMLERLNRLEEENRIIKWVFCDLKDALSDFTDALEMLEEDEDNEEE